MLAHECIKANAQSSIRIGLTCVLLKIQAFAHQSCVHDFNFIWRTAIVSRDFLRFSFTVDIWVVQRLNMKSYTVYCSQLCFSLNTVLLSCYYYLTSVTDVIIAGVTLNLKTYFYRRVLNFLYYIDYLFFMICLRINQRDVCWCVFVSCSFLRFRLYCGNRVYHCNSVRLF